MRNASRVSSRRNWNSKKARATATCVAIALTLLIPSLAPPLPASGAVAANGAPLSGTGSSFAAPAIETWVEHVTTTPYNLAIQYASTNSGTGRYEFTNQTTDWAVSDIGYVGNSDATPPSFPFNFIPVTAGGIAFMYNLPGLTKRLQLTSYTACALLTGGITNWDSSLLAADNPGVTLPNLVVQPVTESDSAGTNYVLEEWCIDEQPSLWASFVAAQEAQSGGPSDGVPLSATSPESNWPSPKGGLDTTSTTAVAGDVADNAGAIGPVQVQYAKDLGFNGTDPTKNVALVQNASGDYTGPTPVYDVSSALAYASQLPNGTHQLNFNGTGPNVYNPSTYSYLLTPTTGWPAAKGETLSQFVDYVLTLGQQLAPSFGYASLGLSLEQYGVNAVQKNVPGAVAPTAAEQQAYSCGDLTPEEVQAGQTTPTCGVVTSTAPPPSANGGTTKGTAVAPSSSGSTATSAPGSTATTAGKGSTTTAGKGVSTSSNSIAAALGSASSTGGAAGAGTTGGGTAGGSTAGGSTTGGSTAGGADPSVSLAATGAMPNTGGDPVPLTILGATLLLLGAFGRRRVLAMRRGAAK
jgi:phosphate transport system substrate-binding protein